MITGGSKAVRGISQSRGAIMMLVDEPGRVNFVRRVIHRRDHQRGGEEVPHQFGPGIATAT